VSRRRRSRRRSLAEARRWYRGQSPAVRAGLVVLATVELVLIALAERDIGHRSAGELRGPRTMWRIAALNNFVGPLAYFRWGRRR
jgi:hypothetical protein